METRWLDGTAAENNFEAETADWRGTWQRCVEGILHRPEQDEAKRSGRNGEEILDIHLGARCRW